MPQTHLCCLVDRTMVTTPDNEEMSWELSVQIDQKSGDESMKFKLRVKGDLHVGGLMLKLVEKISKCLIWVRTLNIDHRDIFTSSLT